MTPDGLASAMNEVFTNKRTGLRRSRADRWALMVARRMLSPDLVVLGAWPSDHRG